MAHWRWSGLLLAVATILSAQDSRDRPATLSVLAPAGSSNIVIKGPDRPEPPERNRTHENLILPMYEYWYGEEVRNTSAPPVATWATWVSRALPSRGVIETFPPAKPSVENVPKAKTPRPDPGKIFLIALKDGSRRSATAYWIQDDQMHFIPAPGDRSGPAQVPLELVADLTTALP